MAILTLMEAKAHLRLSGDVEDALLGRLIEAAEDHVAQHLDRTVPWHDEEGVAVAVPASLTAAALLIVADLYVNREAAFVATNYIPNPTVAALLSPYRVLSV